MKASEKKSAEIRDYTVVQYLK